MITSLRGSDVISYHNVGYIAVAVPTLMHSKVRFSRTDVHCEFPLMHSKVRCSRMAYTVSFLLCAVRYGVSARTYTVSFLGQS